MSLARSGTITNLSDASGSSSSRPRVPSGGRSYLPLSVSTRSMSRRDLSSSVSTTPLTTPAPGLAGSKLMSSRNLASTARTRLSSSTSTAYRVPLHETMLNDPRRVGGGGKRKSDEADREGIRKAMRLQREHAQAGEGSVYPSTPVKRVGIIEDQPKPTPARHILRFGKMIPVDDDDEDEDNEAMEGIVARPPTPPRVHDRSASLSTSVRPITPGRPLSTPAPALPAVQVMSTTPDTTPPPLAPAPITPHRSSFAGMSRLGHSPLPPPPLAAPAGVVPKVEGVKAAVTRIEEKEKEKAAERPTGIPQPTPRRLGGFGGMSRLGVPPSPASKAFMSPLRPPPPPSVCAASAPRLPQPATAAGPAAAAPRRLVQSTLTSSASVSKPTSSTAVAASAPAPAARGMTRSSSRLPTSSTLTRSTLTRSTSTMSRSGSLASLANMSTSIAESDLLQVTEDVEMESAEPQEANKSVSMPPPSKIPIKSSRAMQPFPRPSLSSSASSASLAPEKPPPPAPAPAVARAEPPKPKPSLSSLPERRPTSRPTMTSMPPPRLSTSASLAKIAETPEASSSTIKRKPSYPSSLGHGAPRQPTPRMVSVPVPSHIIDRTPMETGSGMDLEEPFQNPHKGRSVSNPEGRQLSLSTRREGWTQTSRSLAGLSDALEKLKVKKDLSSSVSRANLSASTSIRISPPASVTGVLQDSTASVNVPSERLSAVHRPRPGSAASNYGDTSLSMDGTDRSLAALMCSTSGGGCLKGVVAFVDVWTADGTDSGGVFVDMLKGLGARVLGRPTESCTHIIYKSGRPSTLTWYRKQEEPPHIVGISWVTKSKEAGKRLPEDGFCVDVAEEDIFAKRRKSMVPKAMTASIGYAHPAPGPSASLMEARRKSLVYAPKIGSPLKRDNRVLPELN